MKRSSGYTLMEAMLAVAVCAIIAGATAKLFSKMAPLYKRMQVRQEIMNDSRGAMARIVQMLQKGRAQTLVIRTLDGIPNSRVEFVLTSGGNCAIFLANGAVRIREDARDVNLGAHVTGLNFTGDSRDPSLVYVTLRLDKPYDATKDPTHVSTIILPNQIARMVEPHG